jgi:hypothetical protein
VEPLVDDLRLECDAEECFSVVRNEPWVKAQTYTQGVYYEKVRRVRRVDLQLLSEPQHVVVHCPCAGVGLVSPN